MSFDSWIKKNTTSLKNKTVVITGTTNGLGKEALKTLINLEASVIVGVRNTVRAEEQKQELLKTFPNAQLTIYKLDLTDVASIKNFARKINFLCQDGIDVLINNAGIFSNGKEILNNGYEKHFFTNCIAPFMLSKILKPLLNENSKLIFLGSLSCNFSKIDFNDIDFRTRTSDLQIYSNTKRWLTFAALKLKDELKASNICVNIVHPGISATSLFKSWALKIFNPLMKLVFPSVKKASLCEIAGIFFSTNSFEWIGPTKFKVWGYPKVNKLKIKHFKPEEVDKCYEKINEIVSGLLKM